MPIAVPIIVYCKRWRHLLLQLFTVRHRSSLFCPRVPGNHDDGRGYHDGDDDDDDDGDDDDDDDDGDECSVFLVESLFIHIGIEKSCGSC